MPGTITPIGVGTAHAYTRLTSAGPPVANQLAAPGDTNPPILFEPPAGLTGSAAELWIVATGGAAWGGCQVWASTDGNTYALAGTIFAGARQGVLTAPLPAAADPDLADTLAIDLTMSQGQLLSGTKTDADGLVTLCIVGGELLSYQTATLTARYKYNLTYLRRGAYGSAVAAHLAGAAFARFGPNDASVLKYAYPVNFTGRTLFLKLPAFNLFGEALQSLAAVSAVSITLLGSGAVTPANNPAIAALATGTAADWGNVAQPVAATTDLGTLSLAAGQTIDLGAPL